MMIHFREWLTAFCNNRWLVFVVAMWIQSCAGIGYLFGSMSPVIKSSMNYNQRQIARLGVAKDLGDSVGFLAGALCEALPFWGALLVGVTQNFLGYGWVWLIVTGRLPSLPLWAMCVLIFVGTNGETYFNTVALVSCVRNFPKNRGLVVGILKGFSGLSGAILIQIYAGIHTPDHSWLIFMVAVVPSVVVSSLMFIVRPVGGHKQAQPYDGLSFMFIYIICLLLAAYLMSVMILEDLFDFSPDVISVFTGILCVILLIPIIVPSSLSFSSESHSPEEESLLKGEPSKCRSSFQEVIFSEIEDEKPREIDSLPPPERQKWIARFQVKLLHAAAEGAVRVKWKKGPHRGEDFTLTEALIKADFWLIFFSLLLGSGSGLTVIDNLGQMCQSLGYGNPHIFVSLISIWNFLGRVGGGYFSEIIVRDYAYPRAIAMAMAQALMAVGHIFIGMGWPGAMYVSTLLIGVGYGAHWAIVPAAASELFGLKKFGALYNFLTLANPAGSLVLSGLLASSIYDYEAEKQAHAAHHHSNLAALHQFKEPFMCEGFVCFFLTSMVMSVLCLIAVVLSLILVYRTRIVYAHLYQKSRT